ncbi:thioredoxin [Planctomycetales bacterium]|nr:thioredoxin [Planctomycetales bacterium]
MKKIVYILPLLFITVAASAQQANQVLLDRSLKMQPIQSDVEIDIPDENEAKKCELIIKEDGSGMSLLNPQKQIIRVFSDTDGDANRRIDQWSYYLNGIEVYRELDTDGNGKRDQFRWLNTAGTRWGVDENEDGTIDYWKEISAQEVSREVVKALATEDVQRFLCVALSVKELKALELGSELNETVSRKIAKLKSGFAEAVAAVNFKNGNEVEWYQLNAVLPGSIPKGQQNLQKDLTVYENASVTIGDGGSPKQIAVGTLVKIGDNNWRTIDIPRVYDENYPLFTFIQPAGVTNSTGPTDSEVVTLMNKIQELQNEIPALPKNQRPEKHEQVIGLLLEIVKKSSTEDEKENWIRQLADTIMDAAGRNEYPKGKDQIAKLFNSVNKQGKKELAAHIKSRQIMTDYYAALAEETDQIKAYSAWLEKLEDLCNTFPDTDAGLEGMLQLASYKEMAGQANEESIKWYSKAAEVGGNKPAALKARGAIRRLTAEGKAVPFKATDTTGRAFDTTQYAGKNILLVFYDNNSSNTLPLVKAVTDKFAAKGLVTVSVCVDDEKPAEINWRTLYTPGGSEGELATFWGIITPPYMVLYGKDGKVARTNIISAEELQQILAELLE